jgi:hypothetical protein
MAIDTILRQLANHEKIGDMSEFREWVDSMIYTGQRSAKNVLFVYENESHYHALVPMIEQMIKSYDEYCTMTIAHSSRVIHIICHFLSLRITFARMHEYHRIVGLHGIDYVVMYLPQCESFLQRLLIATMP